MTSKKLLWLNNLAPRLMCVRISYYMSSGNLLVSRAYTYLYMLLNRTVHASPERWRASKHRNTVSCFLLEIWLHAEVIIAASIEVTIPIQSAYTKHHSGIRCVGSPGHGTPMVDSSSTRYLLGLVVYKVARPNGGSHRYLANDKSFKTPDLCDRYPITNPRVTI